MILVKRGTPIQTVDDWFQHAPPKGGEAHWVPGKSALELARAWCASGSPIVPNSLQDLLNSCPELGTVEVQTLEPECLLPFDNLPGEPRNSDLAGMARSSFGLIAIAIEAKADEPFGRLVQDELDAAAKKIGADTRTNMVTRIQWLADALLSPPVEGGTSLGELRYQLLTATAGLMTLASRIKAAASVLVIHEFHTWRTDNRKQEANAEDLARFLSRLAGSAPRQMTGASLAGPFTVPGFPQVPLYLGKIVDTVPEWRPTTA